MKFTSNVCRTNDPDHFFVTVQEAEEAESPKRSIRDSGYIDCWDSERSDSLSPPRHGREDSFDSLDSLGSRSRQTPSPDVPVTRGSSDGRRMLPHFLVHVLHQAGGCGFELRSGLCVIFRHLEIYLGRKVTPLWASNFLAPHSLLNNPFSIPAFS